LPLSSGYNFSKVFAFGIQPNTIPRISLNISLPPAVTELAMQEAQILEEVI